MDLMMRPHPVLYAGVMLQFMLNVATQFLPGQPFPFPYPGQAAAVMQQRPQMIPMSPHQTLIQQMPPMPPHMPFQMPQQRVPMVVMPYYSKNDRKPKRPKRNKNKRKRIPKRPIYEDSSSESDTSESCSSDVDFRATRRMPNKRAHRVLTPVVSYVTKDGYVVYQKKIKKDKAKDWLEMGKKKKANLMEESGEKVSEEVYEDLKRKMRHAKRKRARNN